RGPECGCRTRPADGSPPAPARCRRRPPPRRRCPARWPGSGVAPAGSPVRFPDVAGQPHAVPERFLRCSYPPPAAQTHPAASSSLPVVLHFASRARPGLLRVVAELPLGPALREPAPPLVQFHLDVAEPLALFVRGELPLLHGGAQPLFVGDQLVDPAQDVSIRHRVPPRSCKRTAVLRVPVRRPASTRAAVRCRTGCSAALRRRDRGRR